MFSNDNNIESIAQLIEEVKRYAQLKGEYFRLTAVEKAVRVLTVLAMIIILTFLVFLTLTYFSFALAFALGDIVGTVMGFVIVGCIYAFFFGLCIAFRRAWIERPLVRFFASLLME